MIALLIGGIYLIVKKVISWKIPVTYIATLAVFVFIFGGFDANYVLAQVCGGGLIFGRSLWRPIMLPAPLHLWDRSYSGIMLGLLTGIFRLWGASPEGRFLRYHPVQPFRCP